MSEYLEEILTELGWDDGFQIPVANAENKALEEALARLTLEKIRKKTILDNAEEKFENLKKHLKHVEQECVQNQELITSYNQQFQQEENNFVAQKSEKERTLQDYNQLSKQLKATDQRRVFKKNQLEKCVGTLDKLKVETNWDSEALKAWEESLNKRDDDNEAIKKFSKEDGRKYNDLEAKRQNLEMEVVTRRRTVEKMVADLHNYERMMERTGKTLKQQLVERDAMVQQWKSAVKILQQRDVEINVVQTQIADTHDVILHQEELLDEQRQFHQNEIDNNHETERDISELNYMNSRMRKELGNIAQLILLLVGETNTIKRSLISTANHLEKERKQRKCLAQDIERRERLIETIETNVVKLRYKLGDIEKWSLSASEKAQHLEKMIDYEQKRQQVLFSDIDSMQNVLLKATQELEKQHNIEKAQETKIEGLNITIGQMKHYNRIKKTEVDKHHEIAYDLEYKIDDIKQQMIAETLPLSEEGQGDDERNREQELQKQIAELTEVTNLLQDQIKQMLKDMKRLASAFGSDEKHLAYLEDKIQNQRSSFEGGEKLVAQAKARVQETQVDENMLRLKLTHLEKVTSAETKTIYNLQKFRLGLEEAMTERMLEINTNKDILLAKRRNLSEDKGRLRGDVSVKLIRIEQFRKKYEIVLNTFGKGENGQPLSVTHYKIKKAQEKFMLQQEGDVLDCKIRKAEKEIVAMENTLKLVNTTNVRFKTSLSAVDEDGEEVKEKKTLEAQTLEVNDILRAVRDVLNEKKIEVRDLKIQREETLKIHKEKLEIMSFIENEYCNQKQEKEMKEEKLKKIESCFRAVYRKSDLKKVEKYDRDLEIRQLKTCNDDVLARMRVMSLDYPEMTPLINRYFNEYDLTLPRQRSEYSNSSATRLSLSKKSCETESSSSKYTNISKVTLTLDL